ncbi:MAG: mechanosensitive ion channel family protein [Burkholderiales bacterium]|jgi:small-conductance mechanosensitive channel
MDQAINSQAIFYSWPSAAIAASLVLLTAVIALRIVLKILKRWQRQHDALRTMVDCTEEPALLAVSALALQAVWQASSDALYLITGVRHFTVVVLIGALTWLVIRMLRAASKIIAVMYPSTADDNLHARRIQTQARMLGRTFMVFVFLFGLAAALMTFPSVRQIGMGLLASAGVAGLVVGFAAKPLLGNLLAGLQIALTQPIRLDDVVIVEGEWGRISEITGSYVVVALWDERRLIVPLQWFIEHPFQNWTRTSSQIVGAVLLWVDFGFPVDALRKELAEICAHRAEWDHRVCVAQVTDATDRAMQIRVLVSSASAGQNWDLRCHVRERLIEFLVREYPRYLPQLRTELPPVLKGVQVAR